MGDGYRRCDGCPPRRGGRGGPRVGSGLFLGIVVDEPAAWASLASPGLLFMGSFVVRMGVLLGGLWVVTRGRIAETAVALVFVMVARRLVIDVVRRGAEKAPDADPGP